MVKVTRCQCTRTLVLQVLQVLRRSWLATHEAHWRPRLLGYHPLAVLHGIERGLIFSFRVRIYKSCGCYCFSYRLLPCYLPPHRLQPLASCRVALPRLWSLLVESLDRPPSPPLPLVYASVVAWVQPHPELMVGAPVSLSAGLLEGDQARSNHSVFFPVPFPDQCRPLLCKCLLSWSELNNLPFYLKE